MLTTLKLLSEKLFTKYLLITNIGTSGFMLGLGDIFCQKMENLYRSDSKDHDWKRTGRMFAVGLVLGPPNHYWYLLLDKILVGTAKRTIAKKIIADQLVAAPLMGTSFLFGMGLMEGSSLKECSKEWKEKFPTIYCMDWLVWPPAQFINFTFLPTRYRVAYVSFITLLWDTVLSYIKHWECPPVTSEQKITDLESFR